MSPLELPAARDGPAAGAAPDPDWFLRAVVEVVGLGLVRDCAAVAVAGVLQRGGASDHAVPGNSVYLLADGPHEVTAATGGDVVREAVCVQVAEQFDQRQVRTLEIRAPKGRMLRGAQEGVCLRLECLHADPVIAARTPVSRVPTLASLPA
jgi:hypothetical protein